MALITKINFKINIKSKINSNCKTAMVILLSNCFDQRSKHFHYSNFAVISTSSHESPLVCIGSVAMATCLGLGGAVPLETTARQRLLLAAGNQCHT